MTRRALIVGGTGFAGGHLARQLAPRYAVTATGRRHDIRDAGAMTALVGDTPPDVVINLAALTTVQETVDRPREAYEVGLIGLLNLFEALERAGFTGRFLQVSSSEVYGFPAPEDNPLTEGREPQPASPYAVAKLAGEALARQWNSRGPFGVVIVRPFTHIGPGQSERFAVARFARHIAEVMLDRRPPSITVGNLSATRDLTDVRDVVRAYDDALHNGRTDTLYNICSGREVTMSEVLDQLIELSGVPIAIERDESLVRRAEADRLCGSHDRLTADTGWQPRIPLRDTLSAMLEFETERLTRAAANSHQAAAFHRGAAIARQ